MGKQYLTKSKFTLATECVAKLYYGDRPMEYQNLKTEDAFLKALAKAGYQVGELAKCYYRDQNPADLTGLFTDEALMQTFDLLKKDKVVIFEAAIEHENLLLRADILIKNNDHLTLVEVKSSTWDKNKDKFFMKKKVGLYKDWLPYLYDVAFQKHVIQKAYPDCNISTYLGLLDKTSACPTQGLNQKFRITQDGDGRVKITGAENVTEADLSQRLILEVNVDDEVKYIREDMLYADKYSFSEYVGFLADEYVGGKKIQPVLGKVCADCEFRMPASKLESGKKCGFDECWREMAGFSDEDFRRPSVLDLWFYKNKDQLIKDGVYFLTQVDEGEVALKRNSKSATAGLSRSERRLLQIKTAKEGSKSDYIDQQGLKHEIESWTFPLHFIDFETAAPAIPLDIGAHPYQGFAFQFSHHVLYLDGRVEHVDQYLSTDIGRNPNLSFIRALRSSLSDDEGTIFRYHNHENTYLNYILNELSSFNCVADDKNELIEFIQSIANPSSSSTSKWNAGPRDMVDLCKLVEKFTFDPLINGKTSIKKVLPAILNRSRFLQDKYSHKIYGGDSKIKSLNFKEPKAWLVKNGDQILDPYTLLPKLFENLDVSAENIELLFDGEELREGGAASIAYIYMQFSEMTNHERDHLKDALLRYCELDTLAMVMIVEAWLNY